MKENNEVLERANEKANEKFKSEMAEHGEVFTDDIWNVVAPILGCNVEPKPLYMNDNEAEVPDDIH